MVRGQEKFTPADQFDWQGRVIRLLARAQAGDGFTVDEAGIERIARDGFGVSVKGYGVAIGRKLLDSAYGQSLFTAAIDRLACAVYDNLTRSNSPASVYIGGWLDTEADCYCLDLTRVVYDIGEAVEAGRANGQKAIWDFEYGESIDITLLLAANHSPLL